jgi:hypothetical protein
LLVRSLILSGKTEELEEEGAALAIGWVVSQLSTQGFDRFIQVPRFVELLRIHGVLVSALSSELNPRKQGGNG